MHKTMRADLMTGDGDSTNRVGKARRRVRRHEEGRRDGMAFEHRQNAAKAYPGAIFATRQRRRCGQLEGADPDRERVEVECEANGRHCGNPKILASWPSSMRRAITSFWMSLVPSPTI